jgi:L-asparaginase II
MADLTTTSAPVVATITREGIAESVHHGVGVVVDGDGHILREVGDASTLVFPRSTLKPIQALTVLELGTPLEPLEMALSSASHFGSARHRQAVDAFLHNHQLSESLLQCPLDWPLGEDAKEALLRSENPEKSRLAMNCSGKHAGFLACCQHLGWDLENYLDDAHPLQVAIKERISELAGEKIPLTTPDGCGAPLHQISLTGLAKAISHVVRGKSPESAALVQAIADNSWAIAGEGHANTVVIDALGGIAKIGAEGLVVIGLPSGIVAAVKILDGNMRATTPVALAMLGSVGAVEAALIESLVERTSARIYGGTAVTGGLSVVI